MTVRGSGERALDLCTGNGIQAILLAAHAESVVATDVNARALAYAKFNIALNGVGNVETRLGSFFEPVDGEQFDLVVANPPYVVSPESAFLFRDGGLRGDAVSEHVVRRAPARASARRVRLADDRVGARFRRPDGSVHVAGSRARAATRSCSTRRPTIRSRRRRCGTASSRISRTRTPTQSTAGSRTTAELGIEQLGYACLVLRKRGDGRDGWFETHAAAASRVFVRQDVTCGSSSRLATGWRRQSRSALLDAALRVVDDAVVTQETRFADGRWHSESLTLRLDTGLPFSAELDAQTARIVRELDGSKTLGEALATRLEDGDESDTALALARRMLAVGFLDLVGA